MLRQMLSLILYMSILVLMTMLLHLVQTEISSALSTINEVLSKIV